MQDRLIAPAPPRDRRVEGEIVFHAQTELDDTVADALAVDLEARIRRFGWHPDITVRVAHGTPA